MRARAGCAKQQRLAAFGEKSLDNGRTVRGENAGGDFNLMIEASVRENLETCMDGPTLGVYSSVNQARNASLNDRACAHAARLNGDVQNGAPQAVVAQQSRSFSQNGDFRMRGGIAITDGAIAGPCDDLAVLYEDRANGNFTRSRGGTRLGQRFVHEFGISVHQRTENNMRS